MQTILLLIYIFYLSYFKRILRSDMLVTYRPNLKRREKMKYIENNFVIEMGQTLLICIFDLIYCIAQLTID